MTAASLRALLEQAIDYAGLFPPCSLPLEQALQKQASYVRSADSWMLGAFILPISQFEAAAAQLGAFDATYRLRISALGPKTENVGAFRDAVGKAARAIEKFSQRYGDAASIEQFEMLVPPEIDSASLGELGSLLGGLRIFWEAPADDAAKMMPSFAKSGAGFKLRTGGVTAEAFPGSAQIARVLVTAAQHRVAIKFTAGLHHPVRLFHESVGTKMHGFLNVLGAAVLAAEHDWSAAQTEEMLADENAASFRFDEEAFHWREWKITTERIRQRRRRVVSLGSCSFDEPREDLQALQLFEMGG